MMEGGEKWKQGGRLNLPHQPVCCCMGQKEHRTSQYLRLGIDISLVLQQKLHQLDVPIMAGHMQWGIAHLKDEIRSQSTLSGASCPSGLGMVIPQASPHG